MQIIKIVKNKFFALVALIAASLIAYFGYLALADYLQMSGDFKGTAAVTALVVAAASTPFLFWVAVNLFSKSPANILMRWGARCAVVIAGYLLVLPWLVQLVSGNNHISLIAVFWAAAIVMGFVGYQLKRFSVNRA